MSNSGIGGRKKASRLRERKPRHMTRKITALILLVAAVGLAQPVDAGPTAGGIASDNIEYVRFVPFDIATATGARVVGDNLYVTSWRAFSIYDISDPADPQFLSTTPLGYKYANEDVDTNGNILLFSERIPDDVLHVWDVEDKSNPRRIAEIPGAGEHTVSCILGCRWAYGSDGLIIDLRDPSRPKVVGDWHKPVGLRGENHDVEEFKNGFVLTTPYDEAFHLVDVRRPKEPKVLAVGQPPELGQWIYHAAKWPNRGRDRFVMMQAEGYNGPIITFDATRWKKTRSFTEIDRFVVEGGSYVDGRSPTQRESSHWFDTHPDFNNGGLLAAGWYSHGTRIIRVSDRGKMEEVGYFLPYGGSTFAAYWISDDIIYSVDNNRGIDILRYTGDL